LRQIRDGAPPAELDALITELAHPGETADVTSAEGEREQQRP